ncbi:MAG: hypothetical protein AB8V21_06080 [Arsenophonus endosymbiont of Dermacentor nuttalli]
MINENIDMSKYYFKGRNDKSQVTVVIDEPTSVKMGERVQLSAQNSFLKTSNNMLTTYGMYRKKFWLIVKINQY